MKFYCPECNAKYEIADDDLLGHIVEIECEICAHRIEVSDEIRRYRASLVEGNEATDGAGGSGEEPLWFYASRDDTYGPFSEARLRERFDDGELPGKTYVWRKAFDDWRRARDVDAFKPWIDDVETDDAKADRTLDAGDAIEAIKSMEPASGGDADLEADPNAGRTRPDGSPARRHRAPAEDDEYGDASERAGGGEERQDQIQQKLRSAFGVGSTADPGDGEFDLGHSKGGGETSRGGDSGRTESNSEPIETTDSDDSDPASSATSPTRPSQDPTPSERESSSGDEPSVQLEVPVEGTPDSMDPALASSGPDGVGPSDARPEEERETEASDGLFSVVDSASASDEESARFGPRLASRAAPSDAAGFGERITESLLIEIDTIRQEGLEERWPIVAATVALLVGSAFGGYHVYDSFRDSSARAGLVPWRADGDLLDSFDEPTHEDAPVIAVEPQRLDLASAGDETRDHPGPGEIASPAPNEAETLEVSRNTTSSDGGTEATATTSDQGADGHSKPSLTSREIRRGIRAVRTNVRECRQRQIDETTTDFPSNVELVLKIEPTGEVRSIALGPPGVRGSSFERCLHSHFGWWDFGSFTGRTRYLRIPVAFD